MDERLASIVAQVRSGRPLEDVAGEFGWSAQDARIALARAGAGVLDLIRGGEPALEPPIALQDKHIARMRKPHCALVLAELAEVAERQASGDRLSLRRAVTRAATARGKGELREALLDLAAVAVRWAEAIGSAEKRKALRDSSLSVRSAGRSSRSCCSC